MRLDDVIRASLEAKVQDPPPMRSTADRAIAGAGRMRRRHAAVAVCAAAAVAVLTITAFASVSGHGLKQPPSIPATVVPTTTPSRTNVAAGHRPDLLIDALDSGGGWATLLTADGRKISLKGYGQSVERAYQTPDGWLAVTSDELLLVTPDAVIPMLSGLDGIALAPDGRHLAWREADRILTGQVTATTVVPEHSTPAPQRGQPIAYTGTTVVLGYTSTGGGLDNFDTWVPDRGDYTPSWDKTTDVISVYPPAPNGSLYGVVHQPGATGSKETCLGQLDPANDLAATRVACGLGITIDPYGLVSPDGRWLAAPVRRDQPQIGLFDLNTVFDVAAATALWNADRPACWLDPTTLTVFGDAKGTPLLAHIGQTELTPLPGLSPTMSAQPIPKLG